METESKKCPYCAESIKIEAKLCRFCGSNLESNHSGTQPSGTQKAWNGSSPAPTQDEKAESRIGLSISALIFSIFGIVLSLVDIGMLQRSPSGVYFQSDEIWIVALITLAGLAFGVSAMVAKNRVWQLAFGAALIATFLLGLLIKDGAPPANTYSPDSSISDTTDDLGTPMD